ncbi:LysE family transporter [Microbacterium sp. GXF7504]
MDPTAFAAGVLAGLALAVPLGAVGVLLLAEGATWGLRRGLPAAAGVATVDAGYAALAVFAGAALAPVITGWGVWPGVVGGLVLVALGLHRAMRALRTQPAEAVGREPRPGGGWRRFAAFVGLTALNPATLLVFAAIVAGLASTVRSPMSGSAFVAGVAAASLAWQVLLVGVGALLHRHAGAGVRRATGIVGGCAVAVFGAALCAGALSG